MSLLLVTVKFNHSVISSSLRRHGLQHARPACPSPTPRVYSSSCPLSVMPSNHLILCHLILLLPSIFPSIKVFSNESVLRIRWLKYCSFSFSVSLSNEYSGLISFRIDWLDLLAVQGTLQSLLQHRSSKASILRCSAFFIVQLSHLYMTTGKITALTRQTFVFLCILWFSYCTVQSIKTEQDLVWVLLGTEAPLCSPFLICRKRL